MNTLNTFTKSLIALLTVVGVGAWLMTNVTIADASCELTPAQVKEEWRVHGRIILELNPIAGTMNVQNNTECSLVVNILVYNVLSLPDFPTHIGEQTLFSTSDAIKVLPGHSASLSSALPNCYYQIDYFVGDMRAQSTNHPLLEQHLLQGNLVSGPLCGTVTPTPTPTPEVEKKDKGLRVEKTDNRDITRPGHNLTYAITVENTGEINLEDVEVTDTVPGQLENIRSISSGGKVSGNRVVWTGVQLDAGQKKSFFFTATVKGNTTNGHILHNVVVSKSGDHDLRDEATDDTEVQKLAVVAAAKVTTPPVTVPVTARTGAGSLAILATVLGGTGLVLTRRLI